MFMKRLTVVLFVAAAILSGANGVGYADVIVEDFESYDVNTVMDNYVGGWHIIDGHNSNINSPVVKDANITSYPEISGQFWRIIDDNSENNHSEALFKSLPVMLNKPGDYIQLAVYASQELVGGTTASGTLVVKLRDAARNNIAQFGIGWRYWQADGIWYGGRPSYNTWYFVRATLRDANSDGIVDSWDFETFNADMTPKMTKISGITTNGYTDGVDVVIACAGSSSKAVGLIDELLFCSPPPNCSEVWARGYELAGDWNEDCRVNISGDLLPMVVNWLSCNDPEDVNCTPNW